MKRLFIVLLLTFLTIPALAQNYSIYLTPYFQESMRDIFFIDEQVGWLCGNSGLVMKTTNGGDSWVEQNSGVTKDLQKIYFRSQNLGYIATVEGSVLKTTDGGSVWTEYIFSNLVPSISFNLCDAIFFTDDNTGFVIAGQVKSFYLFKTIDGGTNWSIKDSLITNDNTNRWWDIDFYGPNGVMVSSKKNLQKYTTDTGETWTLSTPIVDNFFKDQKAVRWLNATTVISMGEGNEFNGVPVPIYKSTDCGVNWVKKNQSVITCMERVKDSYFKNETDGIGVGSNGFSKAFLIRTSDGGETWSTAVADYAFGLMSVSGNNNTLWALGSNSHVIKSTDFGLTWNLFPFTVPSSIYGLKCFSDRGYALTRNGDVYLTPDGTGRTWEYLTSTGQNDSYDMYFINSTTGFILKENRHIVKTTDGGVSWQTVLSPVPFSSRNKVGGITFGDQNTGYVWFSLNDYGEYYVYKTTDAGENWNQVYTTGGPGYISGDIIFFDTDTGVLLGPDRWMMRTTDGGLTWVSANANNFPPGFESRDFEGVALLSNSKAVAIGDLFICVTTDKGLNWNYIDHNVTGIDSGFYTIAFNDENNGFIGQYDGVLLKTSDGGVSWSADTSLIDQYFLFSSSFNKDGKILFGTSDGYILGDKTITSIKDDNESAPSSVHLSQNYPNPFNPVTTIEYEIPTNNSFVKLSIYDIIGNEIAELVNEIKQAGKYRISFNAANLVSGVYLCRLKSGELIESRKLILIK